MKQRCFYNQADCSTQLTREHVVSRAVLKAAFGDPIRNVASGDHLKTALVDHEAVIKDVCIRCNNDRLTQYDAAGGRFAAAIGKSDRAEDVFPFDADILAWLLKTHFNHFRVIKDSARLEAYDVPQEIKDALAQHRLPDPTCYRLLMQTFTPEAHYFDADDERKLPWIHYRSVRLIRQGVVVSEFRLKHMITWILVPSNGKTRRFGQRARDALNELTRDIGNIPALVDIPVALAQRCVRSPHIVPADVFRSWIRKVDEA